MGVASLARQLLLVMLLLHFFFVTLFMPHANLAGNCAMEQMGHLLSAPQPPRSAAYAAAKERNAAQSTNLGAVVFLAPQRRRSAFNQTRVCLLQKALESVDSHLNVQFGPYPIFVIIASDYKLDPEKSDAAYTKADREALRSNLRNSNVTFVEVPMYSGEALEKGMTMKQFDRWDQGLDGGEGGRPIGYRSMCRLWSGRLQRMDFLKAYKYYMRMDDDSFLTADFLTDPFLDMERQSLQYVYRRPTIEPHGIEFMWKVAEPFFNDQRKSNMHQMGLLAMFTDNVLRYVGAEPYNNFHIATVSMWSKPQWSSFLQVTERFFGFFKYRFGDANIHAIAMGMLLRPEEVAMWNTVPYSHNVNDMLNYPPKEWKTTCGNLAFFTDVSFTVQNSVQLQEITRKAMAPKKVGRKPQIGR